MNRHPGLTLRGTRYYLRTRIPVDLIDTIGREEIWKSLDTGNLYEAVRRYHLAKAGLEQWFEQYRRRVAGVPSVEALHLASTWFHRTDQHHARSDFDLIGPDLSGALAETGQELFDLRAGVDGESVQAVVDRLLVAAGWPARQHAVGKIKTRRMVADVDGADTAELSALIRRGLIEISRRRLSRLNGQAPAGLDPVFAVQPVAADSLTLSELINRFLAERTPAMAPKTLLEYEADARIFKEVWGEALPVREITRERCREIRDLFEVLPSNWTKRFPHLTTMEAAAHARQHAIPPMAPNTANQHIGRLSTLMRWAEREEHMDRNPAAGLRVSAPEPDARDARRPFEIDQLKVIFNAPLYTGCKDDQDGYMVPGPNVIRRGRFWVPLLALYTGCRMGELCQLRTNDVETEHGVHVLQIRPDPDAAIRLKTKHSRRTVPIHPELIRCGFLDFVAAQRAAGQARLFPELPRDRRGSYSGHFQRWANRFLDRAGAKGERQSFHSLRHSFTDALRRAGATGEVIDGMLGWTRGNMRDRYGSGPWVLRLAEVMQRADYPSLNLSHLRTR